MSEDLIWVTSGEGADFKKEQMSASEFNARYRKTEKPNLQTEYEERALNPGAKTEGEKPEAKKGSSDLPTKAELGKMNKAGLVSVAEAEGVKVVPDSQTNEQIIEAILESR